MCVWFVLQDLLTTVPLITCSLSEALADLIFWNLAIQQLAMLLNVKEHFDFHTMNSIVDKWILQNLSSHFCSLIKELMNLWFPGEPD